MAVGHSVLRHTLVTLNDVPVGTRQLEVLAVGVKPTSLIVDVDTIGDAPLKVSLDRVTTLATRDVKAARSIRRSQLDEMELRRVRGLGAFFDSTSVRRYPNLRMLFVGYAMPHVTGQSLCRVYIDGINRLTNNVDPLTLVTPQDVAVFEYHARGTTAPAEFKGTGGCDVIIIWTKDGIPSR